MSTEIAERPASAYVTNPQGYFYRGRHRRRSANIARLATGLMTGTVVIAFAAASIVAMVAPR